MPRRGRDGGSIARQVAFILLGSLFLAHVLAAVVWVRLAPPPPSIQVLAARIDTMQRLLAAAPPADRAALAAAGAGSGLAVRLTDSLPAKMGTSSWRGASLLRKALRPLPGQPPRRVVFGPGTGAAASVAPASAATAAVAMPQGGWMLVALPSNADWERDFLWFAPLLDLLGGALPLAFLSIWAARRITGPLVRLAAAAEHVGAIDSATPLPEEGTREIRKVARALNLQVAKLSRFVADRTRMLAAISHDLRTPLTRLRLRAEGVDEPVAREKMLRDIIRMDAMIASTLNFIREDGRQEATEAVDIAALLLTICDVFADGGGEVSYVGPLHAAGACRAQAMERALTNLIDNALKFGGRATVTLRAAPSAMCIDIEDDGPGIPASLREEVFKPFTRGDPARGLSEGGGGVGLGLAIARAIIADHGGTIALSDRSPHGLLVRVYLPGTAAPPPPAPARRAPARPTVPAAV